MLAAPPPITFDRQEDEAEVEEVDDDRHQRDQQKDNVVTTAPVRSTSTPTMMLKREASLGSSGVRSGDRRGSTRSRKKSVVFSADPNATQHQHHQGHHQHRNDQEEGESDDVREGGEDDEQRQARHKTNNNDHNDNNDDENDEGDEDFYEPEQPAVRHHPTPTIHFMDAPPGDIEVPDEITRAVYMAIPSPFPEETFLETAKYSCCMARFPYISMLIGRLAFQGFAYDTILLLTRNPVGSANGIAGGFGLVICVAWTAAHLYLANYIQVFEVWVYREYRIAFDALPRFVPQRLLPHGFWHNSPFLLCFRAAVDLYIGKEAQLRHLSWGTYFRMILIGIIVGVPSSKENCLGVYISLLIIMWLSAVIFVVFRPHRRPIDDMINVLLSFLNGLMIIFIIEPQLGDSNTVFVVIVYIAISSMAFTFIYAACEFFWWNRVEVRVDEAHEAKNIDDEKREREAAIERRWAELKRLRQLYLRSEELAFDFEEQEDRMRRKIVRLERKARTRVTFSTVEDDRREQARAARARRFVASDGNGITGEEAREHRILSRRSSLVDRDAKEKSGAASDNEEEDVAADKHEDHHIDENDDDNDEDYYYNHREYYHDDNSSDSDSSTSTTTSLQAIRRMRLAMRKRRSSIRLEGPDGGVIVPGATTTATASAAAASASASAAALARRRRHSRAPAAAERARQAVADLQTDLSDTFVHRALDVLGFF